MKTYSSSAAEHEVKKKGIKNSSSTCSPGNQMFIIYGNVPLYEEDYTTLSTLEGENRKQEFF